MIEIRTKEQRAEVAWFSALCNDDYEFLGVPTGELRSSFAHCRDIVTGADRLGFDNILLPSSYQVGQDPLAFAGAVAPMLEQMSLLVALRCGEVHPPMLARAISTLDHLLAGRLTINIISSDLPGTQIESPLRYRRSGEVIEILKQAWNGSEISFHGEFYDIELPADPVRPYQQNGGPLLYFGGYSEDARRLCAETCDVYLMWPDTEEGLLGTMEDMSRRAAAAARVIDYGLRIHVIVRETEAAAHEAADRLLSRLDSDRGEQIKHRAQDSLSAGVLRQDELRAASSDDWIEPLVWSGVGRARSGCGSALVGDPDQIVAKLERYMDMGIRSFIFSGYPHLEECELFGRYVLPRLARCRLAEVQGRLPSKTPVTPLTTGVRS